MSASTESTLHLNFHKAQMEVLSSPARFNVLVAGRRFGKTEFAMKRAILEGMRTELNGIDLTDKGVWIVGPTFLQEKRNAWSRLKRLAAPVTKQTYENEARIVLINDRTIEIKGADDPESLHGMGLSWVALDEYAKMRPDAWDVAIRPMLTDVRGGALFIGTLKGKNHFWQLAQEVKAGNLGPDYAYYEYTTLDNPFIPKDEVEAAKRDMTTEAFREQYLSRPSTGGGKLLKAEWLQYDDEPADGQYCVAVDLAGFAEEADVHSGKYKMLDRTAIAVVKVRPDGEWFVKQITAGRWGVRETATKILRVCQQYDVREPGIERGALKNAVMPYLKDQMQKIGFFVQPIELLHGGQHKIDRIVWALAARMEHGRMKFPMTESQWMEDLMDEMSGFPSKLNRDDMLDALSYVDQLAGMYLGGFEQSSYLPNFYPEEL